MHLANKNNGAIRTALFDVKAANSRVGQAMAAYYPTLTPQFQYNSSRQEFSSDGSTQSVATEGSST